MMGQLLCSTSQMPVPWVGVLSCQAQNPGLDQSCSTFYA